MNILSNKQAISFPTYMDKTGYALDTSDGNMHTTARLDLCNCDLLQRRTERIDVSNILILRRQGGREVENMRQHRSAYNDVLGVDDSIEDSALDLLVQFVLLLNV